MKLVSACLVGINCNWRGKNSLNKKICEEFAKGGLFPVCPEVLGGQSVPRANAEIVGGNGLDVLEGRAKVVSPKGNDVTDQFVKGAWETLRIAKGIGADGAILKARSPSCGCGKTYDGTFSHSLVDGDGVTAALLKKSGIEVKTEDDYQ
jgi:uncharacterized protein YbbK (DUF523 family)